MIFVGIDPGLSGGIAMVFSDDETLENCKPMVYDMPVLTVTKGKSKKRHVDIYKLSMILYGTTQAWDSRIRAYVEQQQAFPNQGSVSNYSTGFGFGAILGALSALRISFETVPPKTWQKMFVIGADTKGQSCQIAKRLFPDIELQTPRGKALDGRADALLIAEYGRRMQNGKQN